MACLLAGVLAVQAQQGAIAQNVASRFRALRSEVRSMGHGFYSDDQWAEVFSRIDTLMRDAGAAGLDDQVVEVALLKAMIASDMRHDYVEALRILDDIKERYSQTPLDSMPNVFVRQAEVYAELGDEAAIQQLIREYRASVHYKEQRYGYSGGRGRNEPLRVTRPRAGGSDSLTLTALHRYREAARLAPGNRCPSFKTIDDEGVSLELNDYKGQVVLLDFWSRDWTPWRRRLPRLAEIYRVYHPYGFEIIGISIDSDESRAKDPWVRRQATWRHVVGDRRLPALFGVYGEATTFLIDQHGIIIGRDLPEAELVQEIKRALDLVGLE